MVAVAEEWNMKRAMLLPALLLVLLMASCDLEILSSMVGGNGEDGLRYFAHTISTADETYDTAAANYVVTIDNPVLTGLYWSELWMVRDDGSIARAAPFQVSGDSTWYMRSANYPGKIKFRSPSSMAGKGVYVFYSSAAP